MKYYIIVLLLIFYSNNLKAQTQAEMNSIALNDYKKTDKELNSVYSELIKLLSSEEKKLLIKAQKDWIKYRDSHCEFEIYDYEGGSMQPLIKFNCLEEHTRDRIDELKLAIESRKNL